MVPDTRQVVHKVDVGSDGGTEMGEDARKVRPFVGDVNSLEAREGDGRWAGMLIRSQGHLGEDVDQSKRLQRRSAGVQDFQEGVPGDVPWERRQLQRVQIGIHSKVLWRSYRKK